MFKLFLVRFHQFIELAKAEGISRVLKRVFFFNKVIIPFEKDLDILPPLRLTPKTKNLEFIKIAPIHIAKKNLIYRQKNRRLRVLKNIKHGYKGFAIVKGNEIIGDIWCCTERNCHPDLEWLHWAGIDIKPGDAYLFEMYVRPEERGGGAVNYMLWKALNSLREEGFKRAYGYCAADNLPALWVHRIIGYKELDTIVMSRVLTATYRTKKGKNGTHLFRLFDLS